MAPICTPLMSELGLLFKIPKGLAANAFLPIRINPMEANEPWYKN